MGLENCCCLAYHLNENEKVFCGGVAAIKETFGNSSRCGQEGHIGEVVGRAWRT